jgi:hypothetical protein
MTRVNTTRLHGNFDRNWRCKCGCGMPLCEYVGRESSVAALRTDRPEYPAPPVFGPSRLRPLHGLWEAFVALMGPTNEGPFPPAVLSVTHQLGGPADIDVAALRGSMENFMNGSRPAGVPHE